MGRHWVKSQHFHFLRKIESTQEKEKDCLTRQIAQMKHEQAAADSMVARQIAQMKHEQAAADSMVAKLTAEIARLHQSRQSCDLQSESVADFVVVEDDMQDESEVADFILATFPSSSEMFCTTMMRIYVVRRSVFSRARARLWLHDLTKWAKMGLLT